MANIIEDCPATGYPVHGVQVRGWSCYLQASKLEVWKVICGHNEGESYGDI